MSTQLEQKQSRREFLRGSVRYLALGGLALMTGVLFTKRRTASAEDKCTNRSICRGCPSLKNCGRGDKR